MSVFIVEMVQGNAVQLLRHHLGRLVAIDAGSPFEEKTRVYQHGRQRQATVPQKKAPGFGKL
jgi:hypothetical protein